MNLESFLVRLHEDESGATAVEYGLICALIVVVMLGALKGLAEQNTTIWNGIQSKSAKAIAEAGN